MSGDELTERVRALEAERVRPDAQPASVEELLQRLIATVHSAFTEQPDHAFSDDFEGRVARFSHLRDLGFTISQAAVQMRLDPRTCTRYERLRQARKGTA